MSLSLCKCELTIQNLFCLQLNILNELIYCAILFVCFHYSDDLLSLSEFMVICRALFRNDKGHIYRVPDEQIERIFNVFDKNHDGFIDRIEFQFCWNHWIKTVKAKLQLICNTFVHSFN